jgi:transitional endoplasmic reticulum ATPase
MKKRDGTRDRRKLAKGGLAAIERAARESEAAGGAAGFDQERKILLWTLRAALATGTIKVLDWDSMDLEPAGLEGLHDGDLSQSERARLVRRGIDRLQRQAKGARHREAPLLRNVELLGAVFGLDPVERMLIALAAAAAVNGQLERCFPGDDGRPLRARARVLADVLGFEEREVVRALNPQGSLARLGLLRADERHYGAWFSLRDGLEALLYQDHAAPGSLLEHFARPAPLAELSLDDFAHLGLDLQMALAALRGALAQRARGFHLLLHGPAGTGKTQLSRALAQALQAPLFEVAVEDSDRDALGQAARRGSYQVAQLFGARLPRALVVFDEMEDAFDFDDGGPLGRFNDHQKGFANRLLEETPLPTIWCSNKLDGLDPAYLRRFDLVLEVPKPPRQARRRILERNLGDLPIEEAVVERLVRCDEITPADCERAARSVRLAGGDAPGGATAMLERVLELRLASRGERTKKESPTCDPAAYSLRYVNADSDPAALLAGLGAHGQGTVLLYGPPGVGKSRYVEHVAERLGRPLLVRYGSDLLDCFVGATEKNIAKMLAEARARDAVLFLDEADSFLGARGGDAALGGVADQRAAGAHGALRQALLLRDQPARCARSGLPAPLRDQGGLPASRPDSGGRAVRGDARRRRRACARGRAGRALPARPGGARRAGAGRFRGGLVPGADAGDVPRRRGAALGARGRGPGEGRCAPRHRVLKLCRIILRATPGQPEPLRRAQEAELARRSRGPQSSFRARYPNPPAGFTGELWEVLVQIRFGRRIRESLDSEAPAGRLYAPN